MKQIDWILRHNQLIFEYIMPNAILIKDHVLHIYNNNDNMQSRTIYLAGYLG